MIHQELPTIDGAADASWTRWLTPALIGGAALTAAVVAWLFGQQIAAVIMVVAGVAGVAWELWRGDQRRRPVATELSAGPDFGLVGSALSISRDPTALTDGDGGLLVVNAAYRERFGATTTPLGSAVDPTSTDGLRMAQAMAWRDGAGCVTQIATAQGKVSVEVERVGANDNLLLWRFPLPPPPDPLTSAARRLDGPGGDRLAATGVMASVIDEQGAIVGANRRFIEQIVPAGRDWRAFHLAELVEGVGENQIRLLADGDGGQPRHAIHVPLDPKGVGRAGTFLIFDNLSNGTQDSNLQALLDVLPVGLALVDRDGRFLTMNSAFRQAAAIPESASPVYPGDKRPFKPV